MNDLNTIVRSGWISCIKIVSMILIDRALRHSRRLILSPQWCYSRCYIPIDGKIKDLNLKKNNVSEHNDNNISPRIRKRTTVESMISCWLICWSNQRQLHLQLQLHLLLETEKMAQLDGSLQRLVLLDAFLKGQVGELQGFRGGGQVELKGIRAEEGRREGRSTWDPARKVFFYNPACKVFLYWLFVYPACKVFIGGLKSSMGRIQLKVICWCAAVSNYQDNHLLARISCRVQEVQGPQLQL